MFVLGFKRAAHPVGFVDEVTGNKLEVCADVILDGSALSPPHDYTFNPAAIRLGHRGVLVTSTTIANNFFNPDQDGGTPRVV